MIESKNEASYDDIMKHHMIKASKRNLVINHKRQHHIFSEEYFDQDTRANYQPRFV